MEVRTQTKPYHNFLVCFMPDFNPNSTNLIFSLHLPDVSGVDEIINILV